MKQLLCIVPSPWWSNITQAPCTGPAYLEICTALEEVPNGYVLQGYGDEPYWAGWFIRLDEKGVGVEEEFDYA